MLFLIEYSIVSPTYWDSTSGKMGQVVRSYASISIMVTLLMSDKGSQHIRNSSASIPWGAAAPSKTNFKIQEAIVLNEEALK